MSEEFSLEGTQNEVTDRLEKYVLSELQTLVDVNAELTLYQKYESAENHASSILANILSAASDAHGDMFDINMFDIMMTKTLTVFFLLDVEILVMDNQGIIKEEISRVFNFETPVGNFVDEVTLKAKEKVVQFILNYTKPLKYLDYTHIAHMDNFAVKVIKPIVVDAVKTYLQAQFAMFRLQ